MAKPLEVDEIWTKRILGSVNGLEYGTVQIVVHDGRIVQIERTERKRFESEVALRDRDSLDGKQVKSK
ncbi:YezD family protein [Paenibacillus radicis (ex Xue et al. 2023)]|uniref:YezD family protein n=1 Tax=Paenibacillus radicis (ex Xue et al. 2023) TaxID=2972489 RepID=A0ABT1YHR6_9BACL|nr:YezD family protein [Paenibacillus radicis (ex Xue et al. 2023)]MCR8631768.1 YezD family protein [Paenibacillus radicis (ex Xue et al. 2023)]